LQEATPSIERRLADALAGLPESEIDTLMQLLARLADSIDRHAMRVMQQSLRA
jgi:hypothetical protein